MALLVNEHSQAQYVATLKDQAGTAVPRSALTQCRLTLIDEKTNAIINGRENIDVLADVSEAGVLTFTLTPADNPFLGRERRLGERERHVLLLFVEWPEGHHHHDDLIFVRSLGTHVPAVGQ